MKNTKNMKRIATITITPKQLARQNVGNWCEHCACHSGHFISCPLITREVAEVRAPEEFVPVYTEADALIAHGLGVKL